MESDIERFAECFECEYIERCIETVEEPEDYEDGSCMTRVMFNIEHLEGET